MKWFKHMTDAHDSNDLTKVRVRYGADGYAVYWYCLELIAGDLGSSEKINFELRHDADVIGHNLKIDSTRVEEMMRFMVSLGLFEQSGSIITCLKLAKYLDKKSTRNTTIHNIIDAASSLSRTSPDNPGLSGLDRDTDLDIDIDLKPTPLSGDARPRSDVQTVFQHWQQKLNHPQAKLTPERQRKISTALKNYSAASLCQAINGCAVTPHNMGHNDRGEVYDDISLIVRDAAHIERFMHNADEPPSPLSRGHPGKLSPMQRAIKACDDAFGKKEEANGNAERCSEIGNGKNDGSPARLRAIPRGPANDSTGHG